MCLAGQHLARAFGENPLEPPALLRPPASSLLQVTPGAQPLKKKKEASEATSLDGKKNPQGASHGAHQARDSIPWGQQPRIPGTPPYINIFPHKSLCLDIPQRTQIKIRLSNPCPAFVRGVREPTNLAPPGRVEAPPCLPASLPRRLRGGAVSGDAQRVAPPGRPRGCAGLRGAPRGVVGKKCQIGKL